MRNTAEVELRSGRLVSQIAADAAKGGGGSRRLRAGLIW